jgi:hypothetical protein
MNPDWEAEGINSLSHRKDYSSTGRNPEEKG